MNVLFLCTHNSARSIMAEVSLNDIGKGRFRAFSAGSTPGKAPNPFALDTLARLRLPTAGLRSKAWDEFAADGAPRMDFVITVCDNAAGEACPVWIGHPVTAHWGFADPSAVHGDAAVQREAFAKTAAAIANRLRLFLSLPIEKLDRLALQREV